MAEDSTKGCVATAKGPIVPSSGEQTPGPGAESAGKMEARMQVSVGKEAPDFEATAFHEGKFSTIKLSAFRGKWVFLCFYPGDFTFV